LCAFFCCPGRQLEVRAVKIPELPESAAMAMKSLSHGDKIKINPFELDYIVLEVLISYWGVHGDCLKVTVQVINKAYY
jgi:hypothetical protein